MSAKGKTGINPGEKRESNIMGSGERRIGIKGKHAPSWGGVREWYQLPEGNEFSLDVTDYRGKVLFLYFFQSWCPSCHRTGFPTLRRLQEVYRNDPKVGIVAIQAVNDGFEYNTAEAAQMCFLKYGLKIPMGQSSGSGSLTMPSELLRKYHVQEAPWTVIIDEKGVVRCNKTHVDTLDAIKMINTLKGDWGKEVGVADIIESRKRGTKGKRQSQRSKSGKNRNSTGRSSTGRLGFPKSKRRTPKNEQVSKSTGWLSFRSHGL